MPAAPAASIISDAGSGTAVIVAPWRPLSTFVPELNDWPMYTPQLFLEPVWVAVAVLTSSTVAAVATAGRRRAT